MKPSTSNRTKPRPKTLWSELLPHEFKRRLVECPLLYLPLGLCEPHGQVSAFGLDTLKAEWLCQEAAMRVGGIVAPSMGYQIHETGYHARWLEETVGEHNPHMTGIPPAVFLYFFLYQLRAFVNAGFTTIIVISGHSGGNQKDLRLAADLFMQAIPVQVWIRSDPELVEGQYAGDHAGKYELSQLMYIRPDLIDMDARSYEDLPDFGGRLALGDDALDASRELGERIMEACLDSLIIEASALKAKTSTAEVPHVSYAMVETIWHEITDQFSKWTTAKPWPTQKSVSESSQWKAYERYQLPTD